MKLALALSCLFASAAFADDELAPTPVPAGSLGRKELQEGMAKVKDEVAGCGRTYSRVKGVVKVKIEVAPDGHVAKAALRASPDRALGACVVSVIQRKASFATSPNGANFSYPYVF